MSALDSKEEGRSIGGQGVQERSSSGRWGEGGLQSQLRKWAEGVVTKATGRISYTICRIHCKMKPWDPLFQFQDGNGRALKKKNPGFFWAQGSVKLYRSRDHAACYSQRRGLLGVPSERHPLQSSLTPIQCTTMGHMVLMPVVPWKAGDPFLNCPHSKETLKVLVDFGKERGFQKGWGRCSCHFRGKMEAESQKTKLI